MNARPTDIGNGSPVPWRVYIRDMERLESTMNRIEVKVDLLKTESAVDDAADAVREKADEGKHAMKVGLGLVVAANLLTIPVTLAIAYLTGAIS